MGEPPPVAGGAGSLLASLLPAEMRDDERAVAACLWAGEVGDALRALGRAVPKAGA